MCLSQRNHSYANSIPLLWRVVTEVCCITTRCWRSATLLQLITERHVTPLFVPHTTPTSHPPQSSFSGIGESIIAVLTRKQWRSTCEMIELQWESEKLEEVIIPSTSRKIHTVSRSNHSYHISIPMRTKTKWQCQHNEYSSHRTTYLNSGRTLMVRGWYCKQKKWERLLWRNVIGTKRIHSSWSAKRA